MSDTDTLSNVEAAEQTMLHDTPAVEEPSEKDLEKFRDRGVELFDNDEYRAHRRDHIGLKRGDPEIHSPERVKASWEREAKVQAAEADTRRVIEEAAQRETESQKIKHYGIQDFESHVEHARLEGQANAILNQLEREEPGIKEQLRWAGETYGHVNADIGRLMMASPYLGDFVKDIVANPEVISELNAMPPEAAKLHIARVAGIYEERAEQRRQQPQRPARISSAPKPVSKVTGKGNANQVSPDDMDMSQYRQWRESRKGRR